jgi:endoglucanase
LETFIPTKIAPTALPVVNLDTNFMVSGIYDPGSEFGDVQFDIKHFFTDWNDPKTIDESITIAQTAGQFPLMTIQPFTKPGFKDNTLLEDIAAGLYDDNIVNMAQAIGKHQPQVVMVRFAHEMDLCEVYVWSVCAPGRFIPAYRHVIDLVRAQGVTNIIWLWSPNGGIPATPDFYPGDEYVDMIGVTGLVAESWDNFYNVAPSPRPFSRLMHERYGLATQFNKPFLIAELGISYNDPTIDRTQWLSDAITVMNDREQYPLFIGWVYYNSITAKNGHITLLPDFRITPEEFQPTLYQVR